MDFAYIVTLVDQFLKQNGFTFTHEMFQQEIQDKFNLKILQSENELIQRLNEHEELKKSSITKDNQQEKLRQALVEFKHKQNNHPFKSDLYRHFSEIHSANIISVKISPDCRYIATTSTDKTLKITEIKTNKIIQTFDKISKGTILCLDFHPNENVILGGAMDGTHFLINYLQNQDPIKFRDHSKYVSVVSFSENGNYFLTGSHDYTINIYTKTEQKEEKQEKEMKITEFTHKSKFTFVGVIESAIFGKTETEIIVSSRNDHFFHYIDLETSQDTRINMNQNLDNHISFTVMDLQVSPDKNHLLVTTDKDRVLIYLYKSNLQVQSLYGTSNDEFTNPKSCWDPSSHFVYSTSQRDFEVIVWDYIDGEKVANLNIHSGLIRNIHVRLNKSTQETFIATCSYDKSVALWVRKQI
ncbi:hypothetical protein M0811_03310 [Anaeramoeba ignava]|uniref:WD40 repeat-containing protein n=1 Tax=Anaeramoeba ignava TaxID=1746090 RepID=A0A9Q0L666_ANAIG|nr:hypothetical protein M0811_03310 [Anaeramoeba ignava]